MGGKNWPKGAPLSTQYHLYIHVMHTIYVKLSEWVESDVQNQLGKTVKRCAEKRSTEWTVQEWWNNKIVYQLLFIIADRIHGIWKTLVNPSVVSPANSAGWWTQKSCESTHKDRKKEVRAKFETNSDDLTVQHKLVITSCTLHIWQIEIYRISSAKLTY